MLEGKIPKLLFGLQSTTQTIVAHKTKELDNKRRSFDNIVQIAQKEGETYQTRLTELAVNQDAFYFSSRSDENSKDHAFLVHQKSSNRAYHGP